METDHEVVVAEADHKAGVAEADHKAGVAEADHKAVVVEAHQSNSEGQKVILLNLEKSKSKCRKKFWFNYKFK